MAAETERILLEVKIENQEAIKRSAELERNLIELIDTQKELVKEGKKGSIQYQENAAAIRLLRGEQRLHQKEIDNTGQNDAG